MTPAVRYAIAVDVRDDDGQLHRIGTSHREGKWECYRPGCRGTRCEHIDAAKQAADKELPR